MIITFGERSIFLNTQMDSALFSKTGSSKRIREEGLLATRDGNDWRYSTWAFDESLDSAGGGDTPAKSVILRGTLNIEGPRTLRDALEGEGALDAAKAYISAASYHYSDEMEGLGAGGVVISADCSTLLWLPKELYITPLLRGNLKDAAKEQGCYINRALSGEPSVRFTEAVVLYKAASHVLPFEETSEETRQLDIRDKSFVPLRFLCPTLSAKALDFTDQVFAPRGRGSPAAPAADDIFVSPAPVAASIEDERGAFVKRMRRKVRFVRWVRRHSAPITVSLVLFAAVLIIGLSLYSSSQEKRTTTGLDHTETAQMLFGAQNMLDVDSIAGCTTNTLSGFSDSIASIYAMGRVGTMMDPNTGYFPPAVWFYVQNPSHNIYGISQLELDGSPADEFFLGPRKRERAAPLVEEDGVPLSEGEVRYVSADYFLWYSYSISRLSITKMRQRLTLLYHDGRWRVDGIEILEETMRELDFTAFQSDFKEVWSGDSADVRALEQKYDFLPSEREIASAEGYFQYH